MPSKPHAYGRTTLAALGVVSVLFAGLPVAEAGSRRGDDGWHGDRRVEYRHRDRHRQRTVIVHHRHKPVVHVYHRYVPPKPPVRVVHHYYPARESNYQISNQTGGMLLGGIIGAITGSQFGKGTGRIVATAGGTVIGAVIGGEIGRSMDLADQQQMQSAFEYSPTGNAVAWRNQNTGSQYTVTPTRTYSYAGQPCREYSAWGFIGGYEEEITGTVCRQPDGSWQKVQG